MSNAIQFLESLGRSPALIQRAAAAYAEEVATLEIDEAQRSALMIRDHVALNEVLHGRAKMLCVVCTPDDESQESVPDGDDDDGDGIPDQDESQFPQK
jgi:hypothetical protein